MNYIVYDTETTGLDVLNVDILQMCMIDGNTSNVILNTYVQPQNGLVAGTHIHGIDEEKLKNNNACTFAELFGNIKRILRDKFGRDEVIWVAYNNFGYDQLVFESNCKRANCRMPDQWKFMDVLPLVRNKFTHVYPNYKLSSVYKTLIKRPENAEEIQFHDALADTMCLNEVFQICRIFEEEFHLYTRPKLDSVHIFNAAPNTLSGYHPMMNFSQFGVHNMGDLFAKFRKLNNNLADFAEFLMKDLRVREKYKATRMANDVYKLHDLFYIHK